MRAIFKKFDDYRILILLFPLLLAGTISAQDSALWLRYPSISPDGERIAFAYKGDIYVVPTEGGEAKQLTTHPANELLPAWSHDGKKIAFVSNRYGNDDVFIMPSKGGDAQRLTYHSEDDRLCGFSLDDKHLYFSSKRLDDVNSAAFPHHSQSELYKVPASGGRDVQVTSVPMEEVDADTSGRLLYQDRKGYEDRWRKHHTSSVTRDIWMFRPEKGEYRKLTSFEGEDRDPVWAGKDTYFFLSERSGDLNIWKGYIDRDRTPTQVTKFEDHPCRFLSRSENGRLCFSYDGRLFTVEEEGKPQEIKVIIRSDRKFNERKTVPIKGGVEEMAISPNGKEIAFIIRGEVFVTSVDHKATKRITNTPQMERSVHFSPDGRSIVYASERNGSWNIYRADIQREEEEYFYISTLIEETPVVENDKETFQPRFSPDGKELAYLEERTTLKVRNLKSGKDRVVLPGDKNYSYQDGDQWYRWSPDGNWFLVKFIDHQRWPPGEVGLIKASGKGEVINLTNSGYSDSRPMWMMDGKMAIWFSNRHGNRSHGGWGSESDVYGMFFDKELYDRFNMDKTDYELWKKEQKEKDKDKDDKKEDKMKDLDLNYEDIEDRMERLTIHSSRLGGAVLSRDGEKLYYLSNFEKGHDLWVHKFYENETKIVTKLGRRASHLRMDDETGKLYVLSGGNILSIDPKKGKKKPVKVHSEMTINEQQEREFIFEHVWRQTREKFYVKDMHGVDWEFYKKEYRKFLPHINNDRDLAELLSELLGELNASHTGARYYGRDKMEDKTASLGLYFDRDHEGDGLEIAEVLEGGPLDKADSKARKGVVLEKIDGTTLTPELDHWELLNRRKGERVLLSFYDPKKKKRWEEVVEPISLGKEERLRYDRWVEMRKERVKDLSNGKVGYVHIEGMNDASFRRAYKEILGRYNTCEAIIVDTRFNGGGWLHDDLATLLSGKKYLKFSPRGQENLGGEPITKWTKKSCVLMNEGNYSDAHLFPFVYKTLDIGPLIGMPVPGTGTAVWWEPLMGKNLVFGIPQVGMKTMDGQLVENQELQPDIKVDNPPEKMVEGKDVQLERAVEEMMKGVKEE